MFADLEVGVLELFADRAHPAARRIAGVYYSTISPMWELYAKRKAASAALRQDQALFDTPAERAARAACKAASKRRRRAQQRANGQGPDRVKEAARLRDWRARNPDLYLAARERDNARRREKRAACRAMDTLPTTKSQATE